MSDDIYGPFLDEELFFAEDKKDLEIQNLKIYDTKLGFVGFDDLEKTHDLGREGSFDHVMFSGQVTLRKTSCLCEGGFKNLLKEVKEKDPTMSADKLHKACKQGDITVEIHCQLALMPVCYLTKRPAHSVLIYSKNPTNINCQRRYIVKTFHISCFRRSELTLQRYFVLKFVIDTCNKYRHEVPREERDVRWLVSVYLEDYSTVVAKYERPKLHRSEVYDHFATHAEWLKKVFSKKALVDRGKWAEWVDEVKHLKKKAKQARIKWGVPMTRPVVPRTVNRDWRGRSFSLDSYRNDMMDADGFDIALPDDIPSSESEESSDEESSSSSSEDSDGDGDIKYLFDPRLRSRVHRGLLLPMPNPTWYWTCNIKQGCRFTINIGNQRQRDAPCMAPLSEKEKNYIVESAWGLYDLKLRKIWKKMCQAHMDKHWEDAELVLDHGRKMIYGTEEVLREDEEEV